MLTRKDCLARYGSDYYIRKRLASGELFRVRKGVYAEASQVPELALILFQHPNAVLTMRNAFYLHGLTDVIPDGYDLATDRNAAKISDPRVRQYFVASDFFPDGIETMDYRGYPLPVYSKERMLVELLRYKTKLPFDYYKELIQNYRKILPRLDVQKLQDLALAAPKSASILNTLQMEVL